jgi:hypothetical protein
MPSKQKRARNYKTKQADHTYKALLAAMLGLIAVGLLVFVSTHAVRGHVVANYGNKSATNTIVNQSSINQTAILLAGVFPNQGFKTTVRLNNIVPELVSSGAINLTKVKALYGANMTQQELDILTKPSYANLTLNSSNANFYLLIFWALGIANKNQVLDNFSALANASNSSVADFASTGGWTLGTNSNSMAYFDRLNLLSLTPLEQDEMYDVATHSYRPCCNNPTAFPDCNHGAALLALTELGASQGLNESKLYTLDLQAQTLWFPSYYATTALELHYKNVSYWASPRLALGSNYSSASGWYRDSYEPLKANNQLPSAGQAAACGV